jgi:trehalose 6-phosphate phosphatase
MKALERQDPYALFLDQLRSASQRVLLLDYDGTLAPFSVDRDHAFPYPAVPPLISQIMSLGTRVIIISGRPARELVPLSGIHPHPEIWGSHGMERLKADGSYEAGALPEQESAGLLLATQLVEADALGRRLELKPGGVAVHWRDQPAEEVDEMRHRVKQLWSPLLEEYPLRLLEFDGGIEIRVSEWSKGTAVETIMKEVAPGVAIAYLGDDTTDEDAFRALKGKGLGVLVREEERATEADLWVRPPDQLLHFLQEWLRETGGEI